MMKKLPIVNILNQCNFFFLLKILNFTQIIKDNQNKNTTAKTNDTNPWQRYDY